VNKYDGNSVYTLIDALCYQTPTQGVHTYGACANACGNSARGSWSCENCIVDGIEDPVLKELALLFLDARKLQAEIASRMHQAVTEEGNTQ
jgi:hypothetical protein